MTKKLILIRHAKSYWGKNGRLLFEGNDHDRPLNKRGRKTANLMHKYFLKNNINVDLIFSSSAKRAKETLTLFNHASITKFGYKISKELYTFNFYDLSKFIKRIDNKYKDIILISHNPSLQDFCLEYIINKRNNPDFINLKSKFPTCATAILISNSNEWNSVDKKGFELKKFIIPKTISD